MRTWAAALLLICLGSVAARAEAAPVLTFEPAAVVASAVTPGQSVVFFGLTRSEKRYHAIYATHREIVRDEDADGVVRFEPPGGVPWKSVVLSHAADPEWGS